ncbi:MAG: DEAD/DEAH box helicase [Chloroflexota bacterium]|nr:DEAD/DEAH box helicase [Chloroflexota bacterium]
MSNPLDLKAQLPHTWAPFFARHGNFTEVQQQAIPAILRGQNALVMAATASGKTEAVMAPLLERYLLRRRHASGLRILYICPTRALVRDLYHRLAPPLQALRVSVAMKSGDTGPISSRRPPAVLLTTPESTDSLLTRVPRFFAVLDAVVLDEIHLFDESVRGDHMRCLLRRIERIREYGQQSDGATFYTPLQRVALSATVPDPEGIATRYLAGTPQPSIDGVEIIRAPGGRAILANIAPMHDLFDLAHALAERAARKTLLFCNTRNEVEQVAAYLRQHLPYEAPVFVHYSNLDPALRRQVESGFAEASVALCVSSSTLELGIDIGTVDDIVLLGPPPTATSFLQRVGRGARRRDTTPVLCLARTPLETIRFQALLDLSEQPLDPGSQRQDSTPAFRPSVLVQQAFSLLKQSPTGGLRLADLRRIAPDEIEDETLHHILRHLKTNHYLKAGRPGEWRAGPALDELVDAHEIYSNIGGELLGATVVDAYSGRPIARADRPRRKGETLLMGGRPVEVAWRSGYRFGVKQGLGEADEILRFHTPPFAVPLEVTQAIAAHLALRPGQMPCLQLEEGICLFHFWGDLYGELLAALLQAHFPPGEDEPHIEPWNELSLMVPFALGELPEWDGTLAVQELHRLAPFVEPYLELGRFHPLLPPDLATATVVRYCDLPRFETLYRAATLFAPPAPLRERLRSLL